MIGAIADPWGKIISPPKITSVITVVISFLAIFATTTLLFIFIIHYLSRVDKELKFLFESLKKTDDSQF